MIFKLIFLWFNTIVEWQRFESILCSLPLLFHWVIATMLLGFCKTFIEGVLIERRLVLPKT